MTCRAGMSAYQMNKLLRDLLDRTSLERFESDPDPILAAYELTPDEARAVRDVDARALWQLGAQPYLIRFYTARRGISQDGLREAMAGHAYSDRLGGVSRG